MYLKLKDDSLIIRLKMQEAQALHSSEMLEHKWALSDTIAITCQLKTTKTPSSYAFTDSNFKLAIEINHGDLTRELENRPSKEGICFEQSLGNLIKRIAVEIDLKKRNV